MSRIAVAMSGGLDSSMAAFLLKKEGHEIIGITADMGAGIPEGCFNPFKDSFQGIEKSREIADFLCIKHYTLRIKENFYQSVISPFCREYLAGRTPNPCTMCNPSVKFPSVLNFALELGCDCIATGHYAGTGFENGRYFVSRGKDPVKDQSYFLYRLPQEILARVEFPLGGLLKSQVREKAAEAGLPCADDPESQEICFIPDDDYAGFIERATGTQPKEGNILDRNGKIIGRHKGIYRYTVGQRRGLGIGAERALYVTELDPVRNTVRAGFREELDRYSFLAENICFMKSTDPDGSSVLIKTRSTQRPFQGKIRCTDRGILAEFDTAQQGISPGQAAVFYDQDGNILAGGIISSEKFLR